MSTQTTAALIARRFAATGRKPRFVAIVADGDRLITHTEETLDAWWASLAPAEKGEAYQLLTEHPGAPTPGVCRFCGCTDERACAFGCMWIDAGGDERCMTEVFAQQQEQQQPRGGAFADTELAALILRGAVITGRNVDQLVHAPLTAKLQEDLDASI